MNDINISSQSSQNSSTTATTNENLAASTQNIYPCCKCRRIFKTHRGLIQHLSRYCKIQNEPEDTTDLTANLTTNYVTEAPPEQFYWSSVKGSEVRISIERCYEVIVTWRKNLFMLPNGQSGKNYIREITRLINAWTENSPLKDIAWKAIFIMPALLLQKPAKESKAKDHVNALKRRLTLWYNGEFENLLDERQTLQNRIPKTPMKNDIAAISKKFAAHMKKGEVHKAINMLTNSMSNGILPLTDEMRHRKMCDELYQGRRHELMFHCTNVFWTRSRLRNCNSCDENSL